MKPTLGERLLRPVNALMPGRHRVSNLSYGKGALRVYDEYPASSDTAPLVLFWFGGSWRTGNKDMYRFMGHFWQGLGAHAFVIDYPKTPEQRFPGFIEDAELAITEITRRYPDRRVILAGHSAGGNTALLAGMNEDVAIDGIIAVAAPCNLAERVWRPVFGDALRKKQHDPRSYAEASQPATRFLLIHGALDHIVLPTDSISLHHRLKQAGRVSKLIIVPLVEHIGILPLLAFGPLWRIRSAVKQFLFRA